MTDTDMLYMASLEKRNAELEAKMAELESKHWNECGQIAHYDDELRRAKELLKVAVEDFNVLGIELDSNCELCGFRLGCEECPLHRAGINCRCWKHQDEALALIGKDIDVPASADDTNVGGKIDSWISCEDRLPGENTLVLCYARSTTGEGNQYFIGAIAHGEFWFLKVYDIGRVSHPVHYWEVTHWQPLPEPPKTGGEQND